MLKKILCAVGPFTLVSICVAQTPDSSAKPDYDVAPWPVQKSIVQPTYPIVASSANVDGHVRAQVSINMSGKVTQCAVEAHPWRIGLEEAVHDAVIQWRFIPARKSKQVIDADIRLEFDFIIHPDSANYPNGYRMSRARADSLRTYAVAHNRERDRDPLCVYDPLPIEYTLPHITRDPPFIDGPVHH
jgi:TonB family protein